MPLADFDFLFGRWSIRNRALCTRLRNAHDWREFDALLDCRRIGRLGNIAHFRTACDGMPLEGVSIRLYDPQNDRWNISWSDSPRAGALQPAITGSFAGSTGAFYGNTIWEGRYVRVRLLWLRATHPHFEQAFSLDNGRTWETNWYMALSACETRPAPGVVVASAAIPLRAT